MMGVPCQVGRDRQRQRQTDAQAVTASAVPALPSSLPQGAFEAYRGAIPLGSTLPFLALPPPPAADIGGLPPDGDVKPEVTSSP